MHSRCWPVILLGVSLAAVALAQNQKKPDDGGKAPARPGTRGDLTITPAGKEAGPRLTPQQEAEQAIAEGARSFAEAYNRHDAAAIASSFTADGEFVTEEGTTLRGREAIRKHFEAVFAAAPRSRISLRIEAIRLLAPNAAIEEGTVEASIDPDEDPEHSRYGAVHVRQDGKWLVARSRDFPARSDVASNYRRLRPLEFLIGEWIGEGEGVLTRHSWRWVDDRNFLLQEYTIQMEGRGTLSGSMRIGWDAQARQVRSWSFDSQGGWNEARWTRADDGWILKTQGMTRLGNTTSATTILRQVDPSTMTWESRDRIDGGVPAAPLPKVVIKRRPPAPAE